MDNYRKNLEENLEDAKIALLMDQYAEALGEAYLKEYEAAEQAGELPEYPEEMKQRCLEFVKNYRNTPQKKRPVRLFRYFGAAAASIALTFVLLVTVQAAGVDVFGAIGRWTDSVFHFQTSENDQTSLRERQPVNELQKALADYNMPIELAPTWIPEGYHLSKLDKLTNKIHRGVLATYENDSMDLFSLEISEFFDPHDAEALSFEISNSAPELFFSQGRTFNLFLNNMKWGAVWYDSCFCVKIDGVYEKEHMLTIINSMGENVNG